MGYKLHIKHGNLINEKADFIINASNTKLILGSGVSMAFKRHCGVNLEQEMQKVLQSIGNELLPGDVVATSSGKAKNFKYALHAAVMNYNQCVKYKEKKPTLRTIEKALHNIENYLEWYAKNRSSTMKIALPLLGCGVGGLDKNEVVELYRSFFSKKTHFDCTVIIYGYNMKDYELIKSVLGI